MVFREYHHRNVRNIPSLALAITLARVELTRRFDSVFSFLGSPRVLLAQLLSDLTLAKAVLPSFLST